MRMGASSWEQVSSSSSSGERKKISVPAGRSQKLLSVSSFLVSSWLMAVTVVFCSLFVSLLVVVVVSLEVSVDAVGC